MATIANSQRVRYGWLRCGARWCVLPLMSHQCGAALIIAVGLHLNRFNLVFWWATPTLRNTVLHWLQKELISEDAAAWIDECAQWAIAGFGEQAFRQHTQLVLPDATHFPEKVPGPEAMARYVLQRVTQLAGVSHWPWQLCDVRAASPASPPLLGVDAGQRFVAQEIAQEAHSLQVPFVVDQIAKPQDLVASTAHTCAQHMLWQSQQTPPGGLAYFEQAAEVLAVFSGFGIMLANSAYTYRGSCARCYNPRANRQASLSESESVYALALFCQLKNVPQGKVLKYLKPYLKGSFKVACKQVKKRGNTPGSGTTTV